MSKRELVTKAFNNQPVERVPVGFWFHFVPFAQINNGLTDESVVQRNLDGHQKFYEEFKPDFVKLMSDGFFLYPNEGYLKAESPEDLKNVAPLGPDHPWIRKQVGLVKNLTARYSQEVLTFYNIFAPLTFLRLAQEVTGKELAAWYKQDKAAVVHLLDVTAQDLAALATAVITEGGADGIYLSVQNWQENPLNKATYLADIAPSEQKVLAAANAASDTNILHICGYEGGRNDLSVYTAPGYDAKVINWAVNVEGVPLEEGKKLFGGRAVIGGFDNRPGALLHTGSKADIEAATATLLAAAGNTGVVLGADCTVPADIDLARLGWVREAAKAL